MPHNEWWFLKWNAIALDDVFKRCKILLGRSTTLQKRFWRCCRNTSVFFVRWMSGFLDSRNISCLGLGYCNFNSCYHESWYIDNVSSQSHPQLGSNWDSSENRTHWGLTSKLSTGDSVQCHDAMALSKVDLDAHTAWPNATCSVSFFPT